MKILRKNIIKKRYHDELELQKVYTYPKNPRDCKIYSKKGYVNIENGAQGGNHWTCFIIKNNNSFYFDSFGGQPDIFPLNQLPKPIIYQTYKIQQINSKLCGSYSLYFFFLIERMNYYDTFLKR